MDKSGLAIVVITSAVIGAAVAAALGALSRTASTNDSCMSCHYHTYADQTWKQSSHFNNPSGTKTDCVACHLPPPGGVEHLAAKMKFGLKDLWSFLTRDKDEIDWESKRDVDYAPNIVYNESCKECHVNLLPEGLSNDGVTAHLYYEDHEKSLNLKCFSCHPDVGHRNPNRSHSRMTVLPEPEVTGPVNESPCELTAFADFVETVPLTRTTIPMKAIPGGSFIIGSPADEYGRREDEGPQVEVRISPFFMAETEITWDQYWTFCSETASEGRTPPSYVYKMNSRPDLDAVTGPTPPFGAPDQGWGMGSRPAITMTHYAAGMFCRWLSLKTGKNYRLPTEAEWEYAARGGTSGPYFLDASVRRSGRDATDLGKYVVYGINSSNRSAKPSDVEANPFGLKNMLGNVAEYCSDWYSRDAYQLLENGVTNPQGPSSGTEHVIRGGLYSSKAADVRCAARDCTRNDEWLRTDPQNPKSIWWYSDYKGIGFRIVCDVPENIIP